MKTSTRFVARLATAACLVLGMTAPTPAIPPKADETAVAGASQNLPEGHYEGDGHDHSHDGHDHSGHDHSGHDHSHHTMAKRVGFNYTPLENLPVQDGGLVKALYTFADESVREVVGRTNHGHRGAMENFLSMAFEPEVWAHEPFLKLNHPTLRKIFDKKKFITPMEFEEKKSEWIKLIDDEKTHDHGAIKTEVNHLYDIATRVVGKSEAIKIIPQVDFKGEPADWWTVEELVTRGRGTSPAHDTILASWERAQMAFVGGRSAEFNAAAAELAGALGKLDTPTFRPQWKLDLDRWNTKVGLFRLTGWAYLLSALIFLVSYLAGKKLFSILAVSTLTLGATMHVSAITIWGILAGRTPVANLFEASMFIIGSMTVISIVISIYYKTRVVGLAGSTLGAIFMGFANNMPLQYGAKMLPLIDALQSYWLRIHVTSMLASYAFFAISFFVSVAWLTRRWWLGGPGASAAGLSRAVGRKGLANDAIAADSGLLFLDGLNFRIITIGFPILTAGVILGAVWAAEAWGRPWGFDPKETAAAMTWMIYAIYLHARLFLGWRGSKGIWMSILGFAAVVFTYLGVSFFLPGLHSYVSEGTSFTQFVKNLFR